MSQELTWDEAIHELSINLNPRPFAQMLREQKELTPGAADILAEALDPTGYTGYDVRLVPKRMKVPEYKEGGAKDGGGSLKWLKVTITFNEALAQGLSATEAAQIAASQHNMDVRHVPRVMKQWARLSRNLKTEGHQS